MALGHGGHRSSPTANRPWRHPFPPTAWSPVTRHGRGRRGSTRKLTSEHPTTSPPDAPPTTTSYGQWSSSVAFRAAPAHVADGRDVEGRPTYVSGGQEVPLFQRSRPLLIVLHRFCAPMGNICFAMIPKELDFIDSLQSSIHHRPWGWSVCRLEGLVRGHYWCGAGHGIGDLLSSRIMILNNQLMGPEQEKRVLGQSTPQMWTVRVFILLELF